MEALINGIEALVDCRSTDYRHTSTINGMEALVKGIEALVHGMEALVNGIEALVYGMEALINGIDALVNCRSTDYRHTSTIDGMEALVKE